jgi:hypothetical protein
VILRIPTNGGFGNRMSALASGLVLAERIGYQPLVGWEPNYTCGASLGDLYASLPFDHRETLDGCSWPLLTHLEWKGRECYPHTAKSLQLLIGRDFEFNHNKLACSEAEAQAKVAQFVIQPEILARVRAFVAEHGIDRNVTGLHVRSTDACYKDAVLQRARKEVRDASRRFFVCSDEASLEAEFGALANVCALPKTHYVEKGGPGDWRIPPADGDPCHCFNVVRSRESVIEAFADLLILSRTRIVPNSSSFNAWARIYAGVALQ